MPVGMLVKDYPALTGSLTGLVLGLVLVAVIRLIVEIYTCWMGRRIRAANNARIAAASGAFFFSSGNFCCIDL
jgi:mannose/fructose/N-acetylgalactosamine-specific phosphotransferase system component IID